MCTSIAGSAMQSLIPSNKKDEDEKVPEAKDIPMGDGLAGVARTSLLNRRARLEAAINESGG